MNIDERIEEICKEKNTYIFCPSKHKKRYENKELAMKSLATVPPGTATYRHIPIGVYRCLCGAWHIGHRAHIKS